MMSFNIFSFTEFTMPNLEKDHIKESLIFGGQYVVQHLDRRLEFYNLAIKENCHTVRYLGSQIDKLVKLDDRHFLAIIGNAIHVYGVLTRTVILNYEFNNANYTKFKLLKNVLLCISSSSICFISLISGEKVLELECSLA
jgi:hypothetical protein